MENMFHWMKLVCPSYFSGAQSPSTHLYATPRPCHPWLTILKKASRYSDCIVANILISTSLTPDVAAVNQINRSILNGYELKNPRDTTSCSLTLPENIRLIWLSETYSPLLLNIKESLQ